MNSALTLSGLVFVLMAWGAIIAMTAYCFWKVLRRRGETDSTEQRKS